MLICGALGIFYLATGVAILFGPWFVKEWQNPKSEFKTIVFVIIYYVGAITITNWIFKILDTTTGCYNLDIIFNI